MRIGLCTEIDGMELAQKAGFDYIECSLTNYADMPQAEFNRHIRIKQAQQLPVFACNGMLPGRFPLIGSAADLHSLADYLAGAFARAEELGAEIVVWGSGKTRNRPETTDYARAWEQLLEAGQIIGNAAAQHGIVVAVEPLQTQETNMIQLVTEGAEFVRALKHPQVRLLADSYHMTLMHEDFSVLKQEVELLKHVHISDAQYGDPSVRWYPTAQNAFGMSAFVDMLKAAKYSGNISLESGSRPGLAYAEAIAEGLRTVRRWVG
jgi:sugar phosphate isomerase/epimerase